MKYLKKIFLILILILSIPIVKASDKIDIYLFHSATCIHCQEEINWLSELDGYNIDVHLYEIERDKNNADLMNEITSKMKIDNPKTPLTIIGTTYYIGFMEDTKESIINLIEEESINPSVNVVEKILNNENIDDIDINLGLINNIDTFFGTINVKDVSLPILSIIIGFIDGFNPCAMWVLLFLLSMILGMKNRRKMWIIGITFITTSALVYLCFMLAWLKVNTITQIPILRLLVAIIALIGGGLNLRSYIKERKNENGCQVVDNKKRKSISSKMRKIIGLVDNDEKGFWKSEKSFILALIGIIGLAISVNLIEFACSSGLPLVFTQILALNDLSGLQYAIYIFLYLLFFLIDDLVIFIIAMKTFKLTGISTKYNKLSHLIGGIIMVLIGLLMVFKPEWLMFNF